MECPFLKKINFKKIKQVVYDDLDCLDLDETGDVDVISGEENFDFEQQSVEHINSSPVNPHQIYYFNSKIQSPESSQKQLMIRFPKQLHAKKMINAYPLPSILEQTVNDDSISSQSSLDKKNIPHALTSKMSMLISKCEDIFQGQVQIEGELGIYKLELKDHILRIEKQGKVKYYVDMEKSVCWVDILKDSRGAICVDRKGQQLRMIVLFASPNKLNSFSRAIQMNNEQIIEERQLYEDKQIMSCSLDSLGFEVQRMEMKQLIQRADTFDILLFKNKNIMSKVQRIFTNSDYDHVGMLLKTTSQEVFMLQATGNSGVAVYSLQTLLTYSIKKYYNRVGYRQYLGQRRLWQITQLQLFLRESLGKRYKFDPMYLIGNTKKDDTYFCSELVAAALQRSGIMQDSRKPFKYLPKHFSSEILNKDIRQGSFSDIIVME